jgi:hypothetical protein
MSTSRKYIRTYDAVVKKRRGSKRPSFSRARNIGTAS